MSVSDKEKQLYDVFCDALKEFLVTHGPVSHEKVIKVALSLARSVFIVSREAGEEKLPGELPRGSSNRDIFEKLEK